MEYYLCRCEQIKGDCINGHFTDMGDSGNDIEEETSGSTQFMTQNEISTDIDSLMAVNGAGSASNTSTIQ